MSSLLGGWHAVKMKFRFQILCILAFGSMLWKRAVLHEYLASDGILSITCKSNFAETPACIERPSTGLMGDNWRPLAHATMPSIVHEVAVRGTDVCAFLKHTLIKLHLNPHLRIVNMDDV